MFQIKKLVPKFAGLARQEKSFTFSTKKLGLKTRAQVISEMLNENVPYQTAVRQYDTLMKGSKNARTN